MACSADDWACAQVVDFVYLVGIPYGVLAPDDRAMREIEDAVQKCERSGDDYVLANARVTLGVALVGVTICEYLPLHRRGSAPFAIPGPTPITRCSRRG